MNFAKGRYNERNGLSHQNRGDEPNETSKLHQQQPVKLQPSWEENNLPEDELNFKNMSMDQATLEVNSPKDRYNLVYLVFLIHGIGTLTPWNMLISAGAYFTEYKLAESYIGYTFPFVSMFMQFITFFCQVPNVAFNWLNVFIQVGGDITKRIVYSISTVVICFLITIILAMVDTSKHADLFFWMTMALAVVSNMANGVYQNTVFGMAAKLPGKYTGAIILGNNISGTFVTITCMLTAYVTSDKRMAAIYYFIMALFVLFVCFDTYFALPLNRFYRHHELRAKKQQQLQDNQGFKEKIPYLKIIKQAGGQYYNVFVTFLVTLAIFPSIQNSVKPRSDFFLQNFMFTQITCFLTFNLCAMIGSALAGIVQWPSKRYLWIPVTLRVLYIPYYLFTNYQIAGETRVLPVLFYNEWIYWLISITMGLSSGYFSSIAMMYVPSCVDSKHAATAGMFAGAFLITGIFSGVLVSFIWPWVVTHIGY